MVGRPPKLTERDKRQIYRMASEGIWSAAQIQYDLKLDVSVSTITRALNSSEIFKFVKSNRRPMMTQEHEVTHVKWVVENVNASIHTTHETKGFFEEQNVDNMTWPAKSPDLNPIENVWGYLTRRVYAGQKQYRNVQELKLAILREWENLPPEYLKKLVDSMKEKCLKVYQSKGKAIGY